ncbi:MAG TPA: MFS transporter [Steroidobacteraceae bacterium]|jgi:putative MFS transporter|nr:MFS transporter [Steroidobacteraceae bacterium]
MPTAPAEASIAARLDRLPASRAMWRIVLLISLGCVFEFYDLFLTAYVAPGMIANGLFAPSSLGPLAALASIRVAGFGTFVFATFAGLWLGVVVLGSAADRYGRKAVFTASLVGYCACTFVMAFQQNGFWLVIWRFAAGIGFGVQLVTVDTYIAELVPRSQRGRAFAVNQLVSFSVIPLVALLGWLLVPRAPLGLEGWRWVVLFGSMGALAVWALRGGIPESPRWLASRGRLAEADAIVAGLEAAAEPEHGRARASAADEQSYVAAGQAPAAAEPGIAAPPQTGPSGSAEPRREVRLREIFARRYRGRTLMLSVFNAAQVIGFYGFNSWIPTLLVARGINVTHGLQYAFVIALAQPVGPLLGALFADRIERKTQIVAGLGGMAAAMSAFAAASAPAALIAFGVAFTLCANVMSFAYHGYQAELFPTRIRSRAVGFVYSWSRLAAAFSGLIVGALLGEGGVPAVATFIGSSLLVGIAAIALFGPATRGLTLEQLSAAAP